VIVESPGKIKKLKAILGADYEIVASMGHVVDLPRTAFGIDLATMQPDYTIMGAAAACASSPVLINDTAYSPVQWFEESLKRLTPDVSVKERLNTLRSWAAYEGDFGSIVRSAELEAEADALLNQDECALDAACASLMRNTCESVTTGVAKTHNYLRD
jgi:hypothetical protein